MKRILLQTGMLTILFCSLTVSAQETSAGAGPEKQAAPPPATVTGSGTTNYIPMWTGSSTLGNSKVYQTGGKIGIATTTPSVQLDVNGRINVAKSYRVGGVDVLIVPGGGAQSLGLGAGALTSITTGGDDTAVGFNALPLGTTANEDTAVGAEALALDTTGSSNTAVGSFALFANTNGFANTGIGQSALSSNAVGMENTALGEESLKNNYNGNFNIAIGYRAAYFAPLTSSNNIHIGHQGVATDNGTVRIGTIGSQTSFFVAGVRSVITGNNDAVPVVIDSNGQLGTVSSSRRFKEDIQDMGEVSHGLMQLRPVTFRYQKPFADGSKPIQYGLVAEEVAAIYPDLVTHSPDGQVETVKYQVLDAMLLNEVQRQQAEIRALQERLAKMEAALASMTHATEGKLSIAVVH